MLMFRPERSEFRPFNLDSLKTVLLRLSSSFKLKPPAIINGLVLVQVLRCQTRNQARFVSGSMIYTIIRQIKYIRASRLNYFVYSGSHLLPLHLNVIPDTVSPSSNRMMQSWFTYTKVWSTANHLAICGEVTSNAMP